jgi:hypothetical protein
MQTQMQMLKDAVADQLFITSNIQMQLGKDADVHRASHKTSLSPTINIQSLLWSLLPGLDQLCVVHCWCTSWYLYN